MQVIFNKSSCIGIIGQRTAVLFNVTDHLYYIKYFIACYLTISSIYNLLK